MYRQAVLRIKSVSQRMCSRSYCYHPGLMEMVNGKKEVKKPSLFPYIVSTGAAHPEKMVTNEEVFRMYKPHKPDGSPIDPSWAKKYFDVETRALSIDEYGNATGSDNQLVIDSSQDAMKSGNISSEEIGCLIHVSPAPSYSHFQQHLGNVKRQLKLSNDCNIIHLNLGCGGLASGLQQAHGSLFEMRSRGDNRKVLLTASQSISSVIHSRENAKLKYVDPVCEQDPWRWILLVLFGDGAGSVILDSSPDRGFVKIINRFDENVSILHKKAGGSMHHVVREADIPDDAIISYPTAVKENYTKKLLEVNELLKEEDEDISHYLLHQANGVLLRELIAELRQRDKSSANPKFPTNIQTLGNTSTPCTLMLLNVLFNTLNKGDVLRFLWIGGGTGCQYGGATYIV